MFLVNFSVLTYMRELSEKNQPLFTELKKFYFNLFYLFPYFSQISNAISEKSLKWKKLDTKSWPEAKNHPRLAK